MQQKVFHQPNREVLTKLLRENTDNAAGIVLRLAWLQGLTRDEINNLTWRQVDFDTKLLRLADREIPLEGDTAEILQAWNIMYGECSEYVAVSEKRKAQMTPQHISRIARTVLDAEGQKNVRLLDLRYDYVLRQLETHDWPYVLRVSGLSVTTYRNTLAAVRKEDAIEPAAAQNEKENAYRIWKIMQSDQTSPAGIALWLSYQIGLQAEEIVSLTWEQIDFAAGVIHLSGRDEAITNAVSRILKAEQAKRSAQDDPHIILTPRTRKPLTAARLSTMVRTLLIRGGVEEASLRTLRRDSVLEDEKKRILAFVRQHGSISRAECIEVLGTTANKAYGRLNALAFSGDLTRINARYYSPDAVVAPQQQTEAIKRYVSENGAAYCSDIAELLHIGKRSTARILKRMVDSGELILLRHRKCYVLPNI